jgi:hypothetical protein
MVIVHSSQTKLSALRQRINDRLALPRPATAEDEVGRGRHADRVRAGTAAWPPVVKHPTQDLYALRWPGRPRWLALLAALRAEFPAALGDLPDPVPVPAAWRTDPDASSVPPP